jgi:hypothetical protein
MGFLPPHYLKDGVRTDVVRHRNVDGISLVTARSLISRVFDPEKIVSSFPDVKERGFQDDGTTVTVYIPEADLCLVENGYHHTAMASLFSDGKLRPTHICRLSRMFPYVRSDGAHYFDAASGRKLSRAFDYRIATIYELARVKSVFLEYGFERGREEIRKASDVSVL